MYHSFLIHSSADGHLGCFHVARDQLPRTDTLLMTVKVIFDTIVVWNPVTCAVYLKTESNRKNNGPTWNYFPNRQSYSFLLYKMDGKVCCPQHSMAAIIW